MNKALRHLAALDAFKNDTDKNENDGSTNPPAARLKMEKMFEIMSKRVPAYKKLLNTVNSPHTEGSKIPFMTKQNYINPYPLAERCIDGDLSLQDFLHVSSGSGGVPTVWSRSSVEELAIATTFEEILKQLDAHEKKTLAVVVFPMGSWVGGLFTTFCLRACSQKGLPITLVTPGNDPGEIVRILPLISSSYQQTILFGYPPFVKTVIDLGLAKGIPWSSYNLGMVFAGEVFTESWRDLMVKRGGLSSETRIVSMFGTADAGVLAHETPLSIKVRRKLSNNVQLSRELFGRDRLPSLMQYNPNVRCMEMSPQGTLAFSTICNDLLPAAPLLRYDIGDAGGIMDYKDMLNKVDIEPTSPTLPFVWVFGRSFWAVSVYGANVFVDQLMPALESLEISPLVTGKFVLGTTEDESGDSRLEIICEMAPGCKESPEVLSSRLAMEFQRILKITSSEYAHYVPPDKQLPIIHIKEPGDKQYFPVGVKHRYIIT